ncbi:MAG: TlyA family RNA methyltransferase [Oscillospiraceae bacterium]|jgi:23S rRNA (cytidine1920-2'-O)/16S rRNA (cytidine1409-2'-O)-methyltransferase
MKERIDVILVKKGICTSRERAKELVKAGYISVNGKAALKASEIYDDAVEITAAGETLKYVGRGGLKLEKAIADFSLDISGEICADIGASTGGFTDCMLQNGAKKVYAVDVGHGQLSQKLRNDNRVISLEGVNARYLTADVIPEKLGFISVDISFISIRLVLPALLNLLAINGKIVSLIKPQFEVGRSNIGKNGIVKSEKTHASLLYELSAFFEGLELSIEKLTFFPIKGSDGNTEYLALLSKTDYNRSRAAFDFKELVHLALNN